MFHKSLVLAINIPAFNGNIQYFNPRGVTNIEIIVYEDNKFKFLCVPVILKGSV